MRRGITQDQVDRAADALVAAGDKPTVEKVRAALGTGSPNTVTRMLDTWRSGLAERLQNVLKLPELPAEAGQAMTALWQLAVGHAERLLQARMATDQAALAANEARLSEERTRWAATLAEAETAVAQARTRQELAEHVCANLDSQLRDSHALREDLIQQRDRLQALCDKQTGELEALQVERTARLAAVEQERERTVVHIRAIEDRVHHEVDRARQETKQWQLRLEAAERIHRDANQALEAQCETSHRQLQKAEKEVARLSGQVSALETSLAKASLSSKTKRIPRSAGTSKAVKAKKLK